MVRYSDLVHVHTALVGMVDGICHCPPKLAMSNAGHWQGCHALTDDICQVLLQPACDAHNVSQSFRSNGDWHNPVQAHPFAYLPLEDLHAKCVFVDFDHSLNVFRITRVCTLSVCDYALLFVHGYAFNNATACSFGFHLAHSKVCTFRDGACMLLHIHHLPRLLDLQLNGGEKGVIGTIVNRVTCISITHSARWGILRLLRNCTNVVGKASCCSFRHIPVGSQAAGSVTLQKLDLQRVHTQCHHSLRANLLTINDLNESNFIRKFICVHILLQLATVDCHRTSQVAINSLYWHRSGHEPMWRLTDQMNHCPPNCIDGHSLYHRNTQA
mmetsp:Transcript_78687/g.152014  ORF Transcript_78687/g.152014 Transcript_78687/m.152014 type:complete len:327 (-) Transcript_78687:89-1069(-)